MFLQVPATTTTTTWTKEFHSSGFIWIGFSEHSLPGNPKRNVLREAALIWIKTHRALGLAPSNVQIANMTWQQYFLTFFVAKLSLRPSDMVSATSESNFRSLSDTQIPSLKNLTINPSKPVVTSRFWLLIDGCPKPTIKRLASSCICSLFLTRKQFECRPEVFVG